MKLEFEVNLVELLRSQAGNSDFINLIMEGLEAELACRNQKFDFEFVEEERENYCKIREALLLLAKVDESEST